MGEKMIAVRAQGGAGKNFIATLLCNYYNASNLTYFDQEFNEYFNEPHVIENSKGNILKAYWSNSSWKFIRCIESKNTLKIYHNHEWDENFVDDKFIENITEGYFIYRKDPIAIDFTTNLRLIKKSFGVKPNMVFYNDRCSINLSNNEFQYLKSIIKIKPYFELFELLKYSYNEFIEHWIRFVKFLNVNVPNPFNYPLSTVHIIYFMNWMKNKNYELCDLCTYQIKVRSILNKLLFEIQSDPGENPTTEQVKLNQAQVNVKNLYLIEYKDLFFDLNYTKTPLDNYLKEIGEYTARNAQLIEKFKNFYKM